MVLREMHSVNIGGLVQRLIEALKEDQGDSQSSCQTYDDALMLWILFIGRVASTCSGEALYFTKGLHCICRAKRFQSLDEMEEVIDEVGPGLQSFRKQTAEIWTEISVLRGDAPRHVKVPPYGA